MTYTCTHTQVWIVCLDRPGSPSVVVGVYDNPQAADDHGRALLKALGLNPKAYSVTVETANVESELRI